MQHLVSVECTYSMEWDRQNVTQEEGAIMSTAQRSGWKGKGRREIVFSTVVQHGHGLYVLIPAAMARDLGIVKGTEVMISRKLSGLTYKEFSIVRMVRKLQAVEERETPPTA